MVHFCNGVLSQELTNSECIMHKGIVMVENPLIRPESRSFPPNRFPQPCQHFQITLVIYRLSLWTVPLWSKKHTSMILTYDWDMRAFFGRGEFCVFHCMLCHFVSRSYGKHHVSSPVMTLSNISAFHRRSDEMWSLCCFQLCVKIRGTIFAEIFSHSRVFLYNLSRCFPLHIQFFCYYSHTQSSI